MQPDPDLALDALALGMKEPEARKLAGKPRIPHDERYEAARKAGSLVRKAQHLAEMPEPLPEDRWWEYAEHIAAGALPSTAARRMGVRPVSVYLTRLESEEFAKLEAASEAIASEDVETALKTAALEGDISAMKLWLTARSSDRWKPDAQGAAVNINLQIDPAQARERLEDIRRQMMGEVIDID